MIVMLGMIFENGDFLCLFKRNVVYYKGIYGDFLFRYNIWSYFFMVGGIVMIR